MMSSIRRWRAGESGRDLVGSGVKSSEVAVWRGSKSSPGEEAVQLGKWTVEPGVVEDEVVEDIVVVVLVVDGLY